ncbi:MAG: flagellar hook basal-body protein [Deltaproteobacteria bacterium]|nr:flagellar hook basal-body protein [Deltaproteobacteria bacterium]
MSDGIWAAASGAAAQLVALDATANNVANAATSGYKGDEPVFREHLAAAVAGDGGTPHLRYAAVDGVAPDMTMGAIEETGRPLDVAIQGEGFFTTLGRSGVTYTRSGAFALSSDGTLVTAGGEPLLGESGRPIQIQGAASRVTIGTDGTVLAEGVPQGRLRLVRFANPRALEKQGSLAFRATAGSGAPYVAPVTLRGGARESSNVSVIAGMARLVSTTRAFDAIERVIDAFKEADRRAAMDVGRIR